VTFARALAIAVALAAAAPAPAATGRPKALESVAFEQRLDERVPEHVRFRDDEGREVRFGDLLGDKPLVLAFAYFRCPMLCPVTLSGLAGSLKTLSWSAGEQFRVATVSIDPEDGAEAAAEQKRRHLDHYGRDGAEHGWIFLTGEEPAIRELADAVGFRYARDDATGEYAHAAGLVVITPHGRISRYLYGVEIAPRDLRLALVEAGEGKIGSLTDQILLMCFHWDPTTGRYGAVAMGAVRAASALTVLGLGGMLLGLWRRERNGTHSS
jgi:protein SCO1